jgi:hypothetical protein
MGGTPLPIYNPQTGQTIDQYQYEPGSIGNIASTPTYTPPTAATGWMDYYIPANNRPAQITPAQVSTEIAMPETPQLVFQNPAYPLSGQKASPVNVVTTPGKGYNLFSGRQNLALTQGRKPGFTPATVYNSLLAVQNAANAIRGKAQQPVDDGKVNLKNMIQPINQPAPYVDAKQGLRNVYQNYPGALGTGRGTAVITNQLPYDPRGQALAAGRPTTSTQNVSSGYGYRGYGGWGWGGGGGGWGGWSTTKQRGKNISGLTTWSFT